VQPAAEASPQVFDNWFDPIETGVRERVREFIEAMVEAELEAALSRPRCVRGGKPSNTEASSSAGVTGDRHGHRPRSLLGTFGRVEISMPRARLNTTEGKTTEWQSRMLKAYPRRTLTADALIAGTYLAGTNTRRVRRFAALPQSFRESEVDRTRRGHRENDAHDRYRTLTASADARAADSGVDVSRRLSEADGKAARDRKFM
jgi:hypothetical protein